MWVVLGVVGKKIPVTPLLPIISQKTAWVPGGKIPGPHLVLLSFPAATAPLWTVAVTDSKPGFLARPVWPRLSARPLQVPALSDSQRLRCQTRLPPTRPSVQAA